MNQMQTGMQPPVPGDALGFLTEALESRSFGNGTIKSLLELLLRADVIRSVHLYQAQRQEQQLVLGLTHHAGDMTTVSGEQYERALDLSYRRQQAIHFSVEQGISPLDHKLDVQREPALRFASHVFLPLKVNHTVIGMLVLAVRQGQVTGINVPWIKLLCAVLAQCISTCLIPNFITLYARPYQRVDSDEFSQIETVLEQCNGNKTMAAKVLGMTPRQLRYRLEKLTTEV